MEADPAKAIMQDNTTRQKMVFMLLLENAQNKIVTPRKRRHLISDHTFWQASVKVSEEQNFKK